MFALTETWCHFNIDLNLANFGMYQSPAVKSSDKGRGSGDKIPKYIETLKELTHEHPADSTIDTQAEDFTGLIQTAMLRSGTRMEAKTKNIKSKLWFDKDCYLAKKEMKQNLKLYLPLEILDIDPELDCEISLTEVTTEISKLGKNKATGLDEIPNEAIKYLLEEHTIYLRNLFNKILGTSQVPQQWTKTIIHPIFKNGDPDNPSNYRGISLISNLSKLFTSILQTRLNDWMERKSILAENQAGFRKGYSCQDHIFTLISLIQMTLSRRRGKLYAFFIDLRKAFDTVPHHLLWKKIALNGLSCRFIKLIKNYYTQMTATVRWRGSFTEAIKIQAGVLQGEPLSPYLFILFLNDLVPLFDESELPGINLENYGTIHLLLYADDIVILGESNINLQLKINLLKKYLEENCLTLNQNKSKIMVFRNGGRTARSETWFWDQQPLTIVAKYTYLGYPLTTKISTQYASQYFRKKELNAINALWRILTKARIKSFTSVMKLLDTIVLPTLLYAAPMWAINQLKTVNNTQDAFLRRLLDLPNFTPGYVLRRECGRISTELNAVKLTLKFWVRILKKETSRLPHACLNYLWKVTAKKEIENSFTQNLIEILDSKGYSFLKGCEDYLAIQKELPGIIRTTTDQLIQNDQMKITDSTHFAHYKFLSESFMTEEYLRLNISLPNKRLVAQHRVLWQFFREERKDFWKENGRNCLLCKDLMDDNLVHYFFQCPLLTEKRTEIFPSPTSGQFRYHSICQLLSSDLNDKLLIDKYFKFCTEAGRMRKNAGQRILEDDPSNYVKAMDRNASGFAYLKQKFTSISEAKIKEGIFVGPQIRELQQDGNFQNSLNEVEAAAWNSFRKVCRIFLGSVKVENYRDIVNDLLLSYKALGCNMSLNIHFLHSHLDFFPDNLGAVSDEHGERFHQDISSMEKRYQGGAPMGDGMICEIDISRDQEVVEEWIKEISKYIKLDDKVVFQHMPHGLHGYCSGSGLTTPYFRAVLYLCCFSCPPCRGGPLCSRRFTCLQCPPLEGSFSATVFPVSPYGHTFGAHLLRLLSRCSPCPRRSAGCSARLQPSTFFTSSEPRGTACGSRRLIPSLFASPRLLFYFSAASLHCSLLNPFRPEKADFTRGADRRPFDLPDVPGHMRVVSLPEA
ncbi:hypothetical protein LAZ67_18000954 [Cordylochernes scorpioides]|uniref:Reverse transcriptase domain-containing protein n=1 Tax=Cordylochernes scorpioides TaxID=51811 RepID=A0ABY6LHX8_9ARAC|nr:hypothetical protein LAZ67_18000954 [Cordylochernes scorpioides]